MRQQCPAQSQDRSRAEVAPVTNQARCQPEVLPLNGIELCCRMRMGDPNSTRNTIRQPRTVMSLAIKDCVLIILTKALFALSLTMIRALYPRLAAWETHLTTSPCQKGGKCQCQLTERSIISSSILELPPGSTRPIFPHHLVPTVTQWISSDPQAGWCPKPPGCRIVFVDHDTRNTSWLRPPREVYETAQLLLVGWKRRRTREGEPYFPDHSAKTTTWLPAWQTEVQDNAQEDARMRRPSLGEHSESKPGMNIKDVDSETTATLKRNG